MLIIFYTFGGLEPDVKNIKPLCSFVRNLNESVLVLPADSQGGKIYAEIDMRYKSGANVIVAARCILLNANHA